MDASHLDLVKEIHRHFRKSGLRLSVAESCTGGLIGHLLTALPGASDFFDSSIVCYSNDCKIKLLGVRSSVIRRHGAVSDETARAMAAAVRKKRGTDLSLSITGNLGPDPMEDGKVGLVYIAVDRQREIISEGRLFEGDREAIKFQAAISALRLLREVVEVWE